MQDGHAVGDIRRWSNSSRERHQHRLFEDSISTGSPTGSTASSLHGISRPFPQQAGSSSTYLPLSPSLSATSFENGRWLG
jgi:hypothetical protein